MLHMSKEQIVKILEVLAMNSDIFFSIENSIA